MAKSRKTVPIATHEATARDLHVYQEVTWALLRGERPRKHRNGGRYAVWTLALSRMSGGVVSLTEAGARRPGPGWTYLDDWTASVTEADPYLAELARQVRAERLASVQNSGLYPEFGSSTYHGEST